MSDEKNNADQSKVPAPPYVPPVAPAIDLLLPFNKLLVKQDFEFLQPNKYTVLTPEGQVLYLIREEATMMEIAFLGGGKNRAFNINITTPDGKEAFRIKRPVIWTYQKMEVILATGQVVSIVRQKPTWIKPVLYINDVSDQLVLKVKCNSPSAFSCDFDVLTPDKTQIGVIRRTWGGFKKEIFKVGTDFEIEFPSDLDLRYKASLIGTCVLIDFMYYEGK